MPVAFEQCLKEGGYIRTKKLPNGKYIHICFKDNKSFAGEVHAKKKQSKSNAVYRRRKIIS